MKATFTALYLLAASTPACLADTLTLDTLLDEELCIASTLDDDDDDDDDDRDDRDDDDDDDRDDRDDDDDDDRDDD